MAEMLFTYFLGNAVHIYHESPVLLWSSCGNALTTTQEGSPN